jgi:anti-sigma B factor antagonist
MINLNITERRQNTVLILDLEGKIRLGEGCQEFRKTLRFLVENGERKILLNLARISYIDSSGLGELVAGFMLLQKNEGELRLVHLTKGVRELMLMTKLLTVFEVYESETEAVAGFNTPSLKLAYLEKAA